MSVESDLALDVRQALQAVSQVGQAIDQVTRARLVVDTSGVAPAITAAVDAADTQVTVTADVADLRGSVDRAVDEADTRVEVTGEAGDVTRSVDAAVDAADTDVEVDGDTARLRTSIDDTVEGASPAEIEVDGDTGPLEDSIRDGLGEGEKQAPASGSRTGGAFAAGFQRSVQGALRSLPEVTIGADTSEADREIAGIRDELLRLADQTIGVDISGEQAAAELARLQAELDRLGGEVSEPSVRVDVAQASAALGQVRTQLDSVDSSVAGVGATAADAGGGLDVLGDSLDDVSLGLVAASGNGLKLRAIFQAISAAGVGVGLFQAAQSASDLAESTSKATVVFGQAVDQVQDFGETSATSIGLSEQAALEATGTFGNLFVALGTTKQQAADLAPEVVTLAGDLASFNNLGVDETLEKLRSGLVGEIEPLRSLGISFDAAAVEAKAMELGLVSANGEITEGAKLQARWALILEQSGTAQGDFARTSDGLANQQRILTAEFQNSVATLGQALLPALLDGVGVARSQLIPAFTEVGTKVLPALAESFVALLPLAGSFAQLLVALAPVITAVAGAIAAVPPELITLLGLLAAFRRVGGSDLFSGLVSGFKNLADPTKGPGGFSTSLKSSIGNMIAANAVSVGLSLGLAAIGLAFEENARKAAEFKRQVDLIRGALKDGTDNVDAFTNVFDRLVDQGGTGANVLAALGIGAEEFGRAVAKGGDLSEAFARELGLTRDELGVLNLFLDEFEDQIDAAAKAEVQAIEATGDLSEETIRAAEARNTETTRLGEHRIAVTDYVAVLGELKAAQEAAAAEIGVTVDETGRLVEATGPAADEADRLALAFAAVQQAGGNTNLELVGLAQAAGGARIAEEDLQTVADSLGVSLDDLETFVGSVNDAVNQFADDTLSTLPSVGDIIGDLGDDFSPQALLDKLTEATEGIANFSSNLEDLAAFPRVQQIAAENGPLVAAALAKPVQDGNTQVIEDLEAQAGAFDLHYAGLDTQLRTQLGPQLAEATGLTGTLATQAFGATFHPEEPATVATHGSITTIENAGPEAAGAAEDLGTTTVDGYGRTVGRMPGTASTAASNSNSAISSQRSAASFAGALLGGSASSGFSSGVGGMAGAAAGAVAAAIAALNNSQGSARSAGSAVGAAIAAGMTSGINSAGGAVGAAAAAMVEQAIAAARAAAQTGSPSKLFADLGRDLADGVTMGLEEGQTGVADAAAALVGVGAAATADRLTVDVRRFGDGGGAIGSPVLVQGVAGMFQVILPPGFDPSMAASTGADIGRGFLSFIQTQHVRTIARSQV